MLWILSLSLLGSFSLTASYYALRSLGPQYSLSSLPSFFFVKIHRSLFSRKASNLLLLALLFSRQLLFFCLAASVVAWLFTFFPSEEWLQVATAWLRWIILFIALLLCVILADLLPRLWAVSKPLPALIATSFFSSCLLTLLFPINYLLLHLPKRFLSALSAQLWPHSSRVTQRVMALLQEEERSTTPPEHSHHRLIESVLRFKDRIVREVMIPRVNLFGLPVAMPIAQAAKLVIEEGYSRIPVYKESIDEIVGLLMYKDLLPYYLEHPNEEGHLERFIKPVFYVPETKNVSQLLQEFRVRQLHMAVVVDEYGGTEGIVTIEDILEEIVGEIADEYDEKEALLYTVEPSGSIVVDARMSIWDLEQKCQIFLEDADSGDYDTIGGFIFQKVGAIPKQGFRLFLDQFVLEVLSSSDRAISKIRITPVNKEEQNES